jgi:hypothetical protein
MKSFKDLLIEGSQNYLYQIPEDKENLLYDFYALTGIATWKLNDAQKYPLSYDPVLYFNVIENH